jgi:hypothetical protein
MMKQPSPFSLANGRVGILFASIALAPSYLRSSNLHPQHDYTHLTLTNHAYFYYCGAGMTGVEGGELFALNKQTETNC